MQNTATATLRRFVWRDCGIVHTPCQFRALVPNQMHLKSPPLLWRDLQPFPRRDEDTGSRHEVAPARLRTCRGLGLIHDARHQRPGPRT